MERKETVDRFVFESLPLFALLIVAAIVGIIL